MKKNATHLRRTKDLYEYTIAAIDTDIGRVHDFYFDDQRWAIRYIVVATGIFLSRRKILISPVALRHPAFSPLHINANLSWEQVRDSPSIDLHKPVSRQHEIEHHKHYGWPFYWGGKNVWGSWQSPRQLANAPQATSKIGRKGASTTSHLRSAREVTGYRVKATDGEIGHLEDFLFDGETWQIRYAIVNTKNWWPGKKVLLRPEWIKRVSWADREIYVKMSRETIRKGPEWNPDRPVSRKYELVLHKHYGYAPYWTEEK
jgi:uncharacterized protein YrrD